MSENQNKQFLYSKQRTINGSLKYDKEFLANFKDALISGGFAEITFKLPHNLIKNGPDEITYEQFLERERNYPSTILIAKNSKSGEMVKVFFVNYSSKAYFKDDTFPSGDSEVPAIYVLANPDRLYGLYNFYFDYFRNKHPIKTFLRTITILISAVLLMVEVIMVAQLRQLWNKNKGSVLIYIFITLLTVVTMYIISSRDTGLYIREKDKPFPRWLRQLMHGDFKDNPILIVFLAIIGTVLGALIYDFIKKAFA